MSIEIRPQDNPQLTMKILNDNFNGGSPYYGMYNCGYYGVPLEQCIDKCRRNGIALRQKDIRSWEDGKFKHDMKMLGYTEAIRRSRPLVQGVQFEELKLTDFPKIPAGWRGTDRRFFPCTEDNRPMQKWGWSRTFTPNLYNINDAKVLSPCRWVGQNMMYQNFIVFDIDGAGHGDYDEKVIEFGRRYSGTTLTMEDPEKPGSFHLYFSTDRLIPVRHFAWAKLDLMGNAVNAAVYMKNKKPNGKALRFLTEDIWEEMIRYQESRKVNVCQSQMLQQDPTTGTRPTDPSRSQVQS